MMRANAFSERRTKPFLVFCLIGHTVPRSQRLAWTWCRVWLCDIFPRSSYPVPITESELRVYYQDTRTAGI